MIILMLWKYLAYKQFCYYIFILSNAFIEYIDIIDIRFQLLETGRDFTKISAGWGHSVALTKQGEVYMFGRPYEFGTLLRIFKVYTFIPPLARKISRSTNSDLFSTYVNSILKYLKKLNIPSLKIDDADLIGISQISLNCSRHYYCL